MARAASKPLILVALLMAGTVADAVRQAATSAFDHGLSVGCVVAGARVAVAGALLASAFLPAQPPEPEQLIPTVDEGKDLVR